MFVIPTKVGLTYRAVAMLVAFAVVLATLGWQMTAQAANLAVVSNTLSDSAPAVLSGHDVRFTIPTSSSLASGATTSITFPAGFTGLGTLSISDITVTVDGTPDAPATFNVTGQVVSFTGVAASANQIVRVVFVNNEITNPAVGSYEFLIATPNDTGRTRVAIIDTVEVTAAVNTSFEFEILGTTTSALPINGTSTTGTTTATAVPFGVVAVGITETLLQTLTVETNARNGFSVTVEQDGNLQSSTGADIDGFLNGAYTNTPTAWAAPANTLLQENTYGHWGLTSTDADLNANEFNVGTGGDRWVAASTTPRVVFSHNGPADGVAQNYGRADVGYQIQISPLQEAGDDYNTTLTYIATPTF